MHLYRKVTIIRAQRIQGVHDPVFFILPQKTNNCHPITACAITLENTGKLEISIENNLNWYKQINIKTASTNL